MIKKLLLKSFVLLIIIFLIIIILELFLRFFKPQFTDQSFPKDYVYNCFEKGTFYWLRLKTNSTCLIHSTWNSFPDISFTANSLGLRNPEIEPKKSDKTRILVLGDSMSMGLGVTDEQTFARLTEKSLNEKSIDQKFEVINGSMIGAGPEYYYLFLKNELKFIDPDIIVIGLYYYNDIAIDVGRPWPETDQDGLPLSVKEVDDAYIDEQGSIRLRKSYLPKRFEIPIIRSSNLAALIEDNFIKDNQENLQRIATSKNICLYFENCHDVDENWQKYFKISQSIKQMVNEKRVIQILIPHEIQVIPETATEKFRLAPFPRTQISYPNKKITNFLTNINFEYIDMLPFFLRSPSNRLYLERDDHITSLAHEIIAKALVEKLTSSDSAKLE